MPRSQPAVHLSAAAGKCKFNASRDLNSRASNVRARCHRRTCDAEDAAAAYLLCSERLWLAIPAIITVLLRVVKYATRYVFEVTRYVIHVTRNLNYVTRFLS